jgi:protoporphyrinogen oxidase
MSRKAIIIGAGPAGLTAAFELLKKTDIVPIVLEKTGDIGGISKTVNYKGNRMDIGGHRFFSKSDEVMKWWMSVMPLEPEAQKQFSIQYHNMTRTVQADAFPKATDEDKIMLVRSRLSRIYFLRQFFSYPLKLSTDTFRKLGYRRSLKILNSYMKARLKPIQPEKSLEDFFINKFGEELYHTFFKDYTEKVWGIACHQISAEWGAQRIKGVSISKAVKHAFQQAFRRKGKDLQQKGAETSLIEKFLYPRYGPGQLWEEVARQVQEMGGQVLLHKEVSRICCKNNGIQSVEVTDNQTGTKEELQGDYFFSTMPVRELVNKMNGPVPPDVQQVAEGLQYRDFLTVGILLKKMSEGRKNKLKQSGQLNDNWIYIQERDVKVGRLQIFNNWSPHMVSDPNTVWIGMEYFCNEGDAIWTMPVADMKAFAIAELEKIGLIQKENVLDATVVKMEKAYPAYFGSYDRFDTVKQYVNGFENLFLVGRNGMHKYNNSDHSMLTAITAVNNIVQNISTKNNIWDINTEQEYHETKEQ